MKEILLIFTACILSPLGAAQHSIPRIAAEMTGYMNNQEYFNEYMPGQLLLGVSGQVIGSLAVTEGVFLRAGVAVLRKSGEEDFFSDSRPVLTAGYTNQGFAALLGTIDMEHGLKGPMRRRRYSLHTLTEEGLQLRWKYPAVRADLWAVLLERNTPRHLEHINAGVRADVSTGPVFWHGALLWDHYGGQLYKPAGDYMRDNITGLIEGGLPLSLQRPVFSTLTLKGAFLASAYTPRRARIAMEYGMGGRLMLAWALPLCTVEAAVYRGDGYRTLQGERFYESSQPYGFLRIFQHRQWTEDVHAEWGLRLDAVEKGLSDYFDAAEHQIWFTVTGAFSAQIGEDL
ncbi:MAG: hypothetical protein ACQEQV_06400 [Fibrobacterota bacterium]